MIRLLLLVSILLNAGIAIAAGEQRTDLDEKIRILDAIYGQDQRICSVYEEVSRQCNGREYCEIRASDAICAGQDPYRHVAKQLFIGYECGDGRRSITVDQERVARIYCLGAQAGNGEAQRVDTVWRRGDPTTTPAPAPAPIPSPQPTWQRDQIKMEVVRYGAFQSYCDATKTFARGCDGQKSCSIHVDNELCGDPYPDGTKRAYITYRCNGKDVQRVVKEGDLSALSCPPG